MYNILLGIVFLLGVHNNFSIFSFNNASIIIEILTLIVSIMISNKL